MTSCSTSIHISNIYFNIHTVVFYTLMSTYIAVKRLTNGSDDFTVGAPCAIILDEGALTHPRVTQKHNLEHLLSTDSFALEFR